MRTFRLVQVMFAAGIVALAACSEDSECPTCPDPQHLVQWVDYDDFDDNVLDAELWDYILDC